jgi:hypothetical protein
MNLPPALQKGERIAFAHFQPDEAWLVVYTSECGATVERELKTPRLVEIKNDSGEVVRSFMARTSGDRIQISNHSSVIHLGAPE